MSKITYSLVALAAASAVAAYQPTVLVATDMNADKMNAGEAKPPFGDPANTAYAADLWNVLRETRLVGPASIQARPYSGKKPHGGVLVTVDRPIQMHRHNSIVIVKRNYAGNGITPKSVANDPDQNLVSVTVMFQREAGYDPDHQNWFWAKYKPDGSLDTNPKGMKLAGRVAKGADQGCIACHQAAPGNDYVFGHDRFAPQ